MINNKLSNQFSPALLKAVTEHMRTLLVKEGNDKVIPVEVTDENGVKHVIRRKVDAHQKGNTLDPEVFEDVKKKRKEQKESSNEEFYDELLNEMANHKNSKLSMAAIKKMSPKERKAYIASIKQKAAARTSAPKKKAKPEEPKREKTALERIDNHSDKGLVKIAVKKIINQDHRQTYMSLVHAAVKAGKLNPDHKLITDPNGAVGDYLKKHGKKEPGLAKLKFMDK